MEEPHDDQTQSPAAKRMVTVYENCFLKIQLVNKCRLPEYRGNIRCANIWDTLWECYSGALAPRLFEKVAQCLNENKPTSPGCEDAIHELDRRSAEFWEWCTNPEAQRVYDSLKQTEFACRKDLEKAQECYNLLRKTTQSPKACDQYRFALYDCYGRNVDPEVHDELARCKAKSGPTWQVDCFEQIAKMKSRYAKLGDDLLAALQFSRSEIIGPDRDYFHKIAFRVIDAGHTAAEMDVFSKEPAFHDMGPRPTYSKEKT